MKLDILNFQGFHGLTNSVYLQDTIAPNGSGKTSTINAYIWCLTGKCPAGYEFRNNKATDDEITRVTLTGFADFPTIERVYYPIGKETFCLFVGDVPTKQSDFESVLKQKGMPIELIRACAGVNILTRPDLTADDLRRVLMAADVIDSDEIKELRKKVKELRTKLNAAERMAQLNLVVPPRTVERPSEAELKLLEEYNEAKQTLEKAITKVCPCCGRDLPEIEYLAKVGARGRASGFVTKYHDEAYRIADQVQKYEFETGEIEDAKRIIERSRTARADMEKLQKELQNVARELSRADARSVDGELPMGFNVVTEETLKNGNTRPTCRLEYKGMPLKEWNYATRVYLSCYILDVARRRNGVEDYVPIIIDNGESVQMNEPFKDFKNLIRFCVLQ